MQVLGDIEEDKKIKKLRIYIYLLLVVILVLSCANDKSCCEQTSLKELANRIINNDEVFKHNSASLTIDRIGNTAIYVSMDSLQAKIKYISFLNILQSNKAINKEDKTKIKSYLKELKNHCILSIKRSNSEIIYHTSLKKEDSLKYTIIITSNDSLDFDKDLFWDKVGTIKKIDSIKNAYYYFSKLYKNTEVLY